MRKQLKELAEAIRPILTTGDAWQKIEVAKVLSSFEGIITSDAQLHDGKSDYAARSAKEAILGKLWQRAATRKAANRRYYLRERIRELSGSNSERLEAFQKELAASLASRKRIPLSEVPSPAPQSTVGEPKAPAAPVDHEFMKQARENALAYLEKFSNGGNDGQ
jgi:hypothetical protein